MPTYEYECEDGHVTEHRAKMDEQPEAVECEECGQKAERIFSRTLKPHVWHGTPTHHGATRV